MGWASALCPSAEGYRYDGLACSLRWGFRSTQKTSGVPILILDVFVRPESFLTNCISSNRLAIGLYFPGRQFIDKHGG